MAPTPDNPRSLRQLHRSTAAGDTNGGTSWSIRMRCIDLLRLCKGDTVLDVGCGTGLSFEPLLERVGRQGMLIAFEQSPQLHAQAEQRAQGLRAQGWQIDLQCARAESVKLPARPDAALFHYVHDIVRAPRAVANLFAQLPPGTRLAIAGMKYFPWWRAPFNLLGWLKNRHQHKPAPELREPWSLVQAHLKDFRWKSTQGGMGYVGSGRVKGAGL